jgi:hypothetical protein
LGPVGSMDVKDSRAVSRYIFSGLHAILSTEH